MDRKFLLAAVVLAAAGCADYPQDRPSRAARPAGPPHVVNENTLTGFQFPESVGCDHRQNVLYVSNFGGTEPKPAEKDGQGYIMKLAPNGSVLEKRAFDVTLNKPKGIQVRGDRLWVTDIDSVWIFDTKSRQGRKLNIPGAAYANDEAIMGGALYVSDNRTDALFRIEPADFLDPSVEPRITMVWSKKGVFPNGLWPSRDGSLLMVGWTAPENPKGIYAMDRDGNVRTIVQPFGRLDGLYQVRDGSLLLTDWMTGSLDHWSLAGGLVQLAKDFKGPADFCVMRDTVYVPDLVKSEIRVVQLSP